MEGISPIVVTDYVHPGVDYVTVLLYWDQVWEWRRSRGISLSKGSIIKKRLLGSLHLLRCFADTHAFYTHTHTHTCMNAHMHPATSTHPTHPPTTPPPPHRLQKYLKQGQNGARNAWEHTHTHLHPNPTPHTTCTGHFIRAFCVVNARPWGCNLYDPGRIDSLARELDRNTCQQVLPRYCTVGWNKSLSRKCHPLTLGFPTIQPLDSCYIHINKL